MRHSLIRASLVTMFAAAVTLLASTDASADPSAPTPAASPPSTMTELGLKYDKNKDGRLEKSEVKAMSPDDAATHAALIAEWHSLVAQYDTNQDRKIDKTERAAMTPSDKARLADLHYKRPSQS